MSGNVELQLNVGDESSAVFVMLRFYTLQCVNHFTAA